MRTTRAEREMEQLLQLAGLRDDLRKVSAERDQLIARLEAAEREREALRGKLAVIEEIRKGLSDAVGFEPQSIETCLQVIAARDAQQRREGAIEELTELANDRFTGGLYLPDRTHYTMTEVREILMEAAKRLREGGE